LSFSHREVPGQCFATKQPDGVDFLNSQAIALRDSSRLGAIKNQAAYSQSVAI